MGALALALVFGKGGKEKIEFEVIERPVEAPQVNLTQPPPPQKEEPPESVPARKVFGVARNSHSEEKSDVGVKAGNTLAAAPDNEILKDTDATSLPIPTDEYLVSKMPSVASEVHIPYPAEAKVKKIEGKVVMELLIDATGSVRQAKLISGPGFGLNEAALSAIRNFRFRPAEVDGKAVAVRIPYTYNFVLKAD